ncbi:Protein MOTHER of FT and TF [Musa troglodytarum]|uniref:Protein MOTHER of FT and TF n=1 Tax=Musa troglodytarum TaxID=320322 RepID=A0A9E7KPB1_9LILI|nr:Protein MOTHER of FT and TF [Musa troglodytarum]
MTEMEGHPPVALGRCSIPAGVISDALRSGPLDHPTFPPPPPPPPRPRERSQDEPTPRPYFTTSPHPCRLLYVGSSSALGGGFVLQQVLALNAVFIIVVVFTPSNIRSHSFYFCCSCLFYHKPIFSTVLTEPTGFPEISLLLLHMSIDHLPLILSRNTIALTNKTSRSHKVIILQVGTVYLVVNGSTVSEGIHKARCIEHILQVVAENGQYDFTIIRDIYTWRASRRTTLQTSFRIRRSLSANLDDPLMPSTALHLLRCPPGGASPCTCPTPNCPLLAIKKPSILDVLALRYTSSLVSVSLVSIRLHNLLEGGSQLGMAGYVDPLVVMTDPDAPSPSDPTMRSGFTDPSQDRLASYNINLLSAKRVIHKIPHATLHLAGPAGKSTLRLLDVLRTRVFLRWAGEEAVPYMGPAPRVGIHRYVLVLFQQKSRLPGVASLATRANFNTRWFAASTTSASPSPPSSSTRRRSQRTDAAEEGDDVLSFGFLIFSLLLHGQLIDNVVKEDEKGVESTPGGSTSASTEDGSFEENGARVVFLPSTDEKSAATSGVHQHAGILCFCPVLVDH